MDSLKKNPYYLTSGSEITITGEAENQMGMSDLSFGCDPGIFMIGPPAPLTASATKLD